MINVLNILKFSVSNILKFSMVESEGANKLYSTPFLLSFEPINRDKKKKSQTNQNTE